MKVSVAIMCPAWDRERYQLAHQMAVDLSRGNRFVRVRVIPAMHKTGECWTVAERCWQSGVELDADYHLVMTEDLILCANFVDELFKSLEAHVERHGPAPIGFYCTYPETQRARDAGAAWLETYDGAWGQALALSVADVSEFLYWTRLNIPAAYKHDDERVGLWSLLTGRRIWQTVPSLVDHLQIKSTLGHKWHNAAAVFADGHPCPDWRVGGDHGPCKPRFSRNDAEKILHPGRAYEWPKELSKPPK